jgi:hypothetical protein
MRYETAEVEVADIDKTHSRTKDLIDVRYSECAYGLQ